MGDIRTSGLGGIPFGVNSGRPTNPLAGQPFFNGEIGRLELFTSTTGWQNIVQETPGISSISGQYNESSGQATITISGTNFTAGAYASAIGTNGVQYDATSTSFNSIVQVTAVFTGLSAAYEPYDIKVTNPSNLFGLIPDVLYINESPSWITSSGLLGSPYSGQAFSTTLSVSDPETNAITFTSSNLPSWLSLNQSSGVLSGTVPSIDSITTYSFSVSASDGSNTQITRSFSIQGNPLDGSTSQLAARSATSIYNAYSTTTNGDYWLKGSGSTAYKVYCLMDTKGGKWMRVANFNKNFDTGNNNFYSYALGSGTDFGSTITSNFNIPSNLFGNSVGSDLDVFVRVIGGNGGSGRMFGSIWRGVHAIDWMDAASISSIASSSPAYAQDGINFTSYTGPTFMHSNDQWNLTISNSGDGNPGSYNYTNPNGGGWILHASGTATNLSILYGNLEGYGAVSGDGNWERAEIYVRVV